MISSYRMKRFFDLSIAIFVVFISFPLIIIVGILIRIKLGDPIIFSQCRPGLKGKPFNLYKFRTMTKETDYKGKLLSDEERLTKFGIFLRATSLDELPTLLNVLKGNMSLVGPRPLLVEYLDRYTPEQSRRHETLPGITGWAQVNGRNAISWEQKFNYDIYYVDNWSFKLDLKILLMTFINVFKREGISYNGHATMPVFYGKKKR